MRLAEDLAANIGEEEVPGNCCETSSSYLGDRIGGIRVGIGDEPKSSFADRAQRDLYN
jgi:hypothetical protein